jgi:hypothetical protein
MKKRNFVLVDQAELEALRKDKVRIDSLESGCWDVRFIDCPTPGGDDGSINIEIIGRYMGKPWERVLGENYNENLRAAIDQACRAEAYPPERPEYDRYGKPERSATCQ